MAVYWIALAVFALPACRIGFETSAESRLKASLQAADAGGGRLLAGDDAPGVGDSNGGAPLAIPNGGAPAVVEPPAAGGSGPGPVAVACAAGTFLDSTLETPGCRGCVSGTYSDSENADACVAWTQCEPGEFVSQPGTSEGDQTCAPCLEGQTSSGPNAASCVRPEACPAGTQATTTDGLQPNCTPCAAGNYCAGATAGVEVCAAGTWDHDADPTTDCVSQTDCVAGEFEQSAGAVTADRACSPCGPGSFSLQSNDPECAAWSVCAPGSFIEVAGSSLKDVTCTGCSPGSFTSTPGQIACAPWSDCQPGEFVASAGDASNDRSCQPCPPSTFSATINAASCTAVGQCAPGTVQTAPATESSPAVCADCVAGEFCAGGTTPPAACAAGFWDHDANPATACAPRTECQAGSYVQSAGSSTTDRTCATCASGTFSTAKNAPSCSAWSSCSAGSYVQTVGSATRDRECAACVNGFSSTVNSANCTAWSTCAAPSSYMVTAPTSTTNRVCGTCTPPKATGANNETLCRDLAFQMSGGQVVIEAEHYTSTGDNGSGLSWTPLSEPGISGDAGMAVPAGTSWQSNPETTSPRLVYRINFTTSGTFTIYIRGDSGPGGGIHDSCWAGMDNVALSNPFTFSQIANAWSWTAQTVTVTAGVHTVTVWARESEFEIDKIVVNNTGQVPTGNGPPESPYN